jgi:hypothetical protein
MDDEKRGMIVEDTQSTAGINEDTGATEVRPKDTEGKAPKGLNPTDKRERREDESRG